VGNELPGFDDEAETTRCFIPPAGSRFHLRWLVEGLLNFDDRKELVVSLVSGAPAAGFDEQTHCF